MGLKQTTVEATGFGVSNETQLKQFMSTSGEASFELLNEWHS
ncbi:hypothetical protein [Vagococcus silagei]|nr:hypothetical protein [Vagococcus silagei]